MELHNKVHIGAQRSVDKNIETAPGQTDIETVQTCGGFAWDVMERIISVSLKQEPMKDLLGT